MPTPEDIERALEIYEARIESGASPTPMGQRLVELAEQARKEAKPKPLVPPEPAPEPEPSDRA